MQDVIGDNTNNGENDPTTKLGDFKTNTTHPQNSTKAALTTSSTQAQFDAITDYTYDVNGNLALDNNKAIGAIAYNYLNLPQNITITSKGTIAYTYDAAGNKLKKVTTESPSTANGNKTITTTTHYIGGLVYESKTTSPANSPNDDYSNVLQYLPQEEGRVRFKPGTTPALFYDYFLKDHLGNVRMVLTEEANADTYPALSFEGASGSTEVTNQSAMWEKADGTPFDVTGSRTTNAQLQAVTTLVPATGTYSLLVRSSTGKIGAGKLLKVMSGDKIHATVQYYFSANTGGSGTGLSTLVSALTNILTNSVASSGVVKSNAAALSSAVNVDPAAATYFTNVNNASGSTRPKAYLNILFFDEQFKFDATASYSEQIGTTNPGQIVVALGSAKQAKKNGYCYIYISNETNDMVYFDNLTLKHERSPILEETHYYPFGLTMAGISSKAAGVTPNKEKTFQDQRFDDDLGLNWVQFKWRNHDPQIGRFIEIDPLADKYVYNSTYAFSENKVTSHVELECLEAVLMESMQEDQDWLNIYDGDRDKLVARQTQEGKGMALALGVSLGICFPELGQLLIASYMCGVPLNGSPQLMAESVASQVVSEGGATASGVSLADKARVLTAGGEVGMMDGTANLVVDAKTGFFNIKLTTGSETGIITGEVNINNNAIKFSDIEIINAKGGLGTIGQQGSIGATSFSKLTKEITELSKAGGFNKATVEFSRLRPPGSNLPDTDTRTITLFDITPNP
ncbi:hypothetical protein [Ferruginibacter sp. HRS2-29]|uniref:hypothetical protein n=1 Tax=Ferruginibacter sp. HRS2-29 TaxID=2487334 RepID=UPI0020CD91EC|nr:hypothetical protein [Ferruginibacter sp. HRS2-29]MCP9750051.1 hypothetical protein [Ferruginibacter sp. HRS2-29]